MTAIPTSSGQWMLRPAPLPRRLPTGRNEPAGALARTASAGNMVFWVIVMLAGYLVIYFI